MVMSKEKNRLDSIQAKQPDYPDAEFFKQLAERVVAEHESPFVNKTPFYKKPVVRWIAAAAVLVPFVIFFVRNDQSPSTGTSLAGLDNIPHESIREYVQEQKEATILLAFEPTTALKENATVSTTVNQLTKEIKTEEISSYLQEEYGDWETNDESELYY